MGGADRGGKLNVIQIPVIGKIPYDKAFTRAQIKAETIAEYDKGPAAQAVADLYTELKKEINKE